MQIQVDKRCGVQSARNSLTKHKFRIIFEHREGLEVLSNVNSHKREESSDCS